MQFLLWDKRKTYWLSSFTCNSCITIVDGINQFSVSLELIISWSKSVQVIPASWVLFSAFCSCRCLLYRALTKEWFGNCSLGYLYCGERPAWPCSVASLSAACLCWPHYLVLLILLDPAIIQCQSVLAPCSWVMKEQIRITRINHFKCFLYSRVLESIVTDTVICWFVWRMDVRNRKGSDWMNGTWHDKDYQSQHWQCMCLMYRKTFTRSILYMGKKVLSSAENENVEQMSQMEIFIPAYWMI